MGAISKSVPIFIKINMVGASYKKTTYTKFRANLTIFASCTLLADIKVIWEVGVGVARLVQFFVSLLCLSWLISVWNYNAVSSFLDFMPKKYIWDQCAMVETSLLLKNCIRKCLIDFNLSYMWKEQNINTLGDILEIFKPIQLAVEALCRRDINLLTADAVLHTLC